MPEEIINIEKVLLGKVASGNEAAFSELYAVWQPKLSSFIFRITKSKELTAEVVQDVFLKIWINREALTGVNNFKSYLFVVSKNQAINAFHRSVRELQLFQDLEANVKSVHMDPEDDFENVRLTIIDEAIDHLPPRQKEIYLLHRHGKLTYLEIAGKLGIGKESVKTHIEQAVKSITRYLKKRIALIAVLMEIF